MKNQIKIHKLTEKNSIFLLYIEEKLSSFWNGKLSLAILFF